MLSYDLTAFSCLGWMVSRVVWDIMAVWLSFLTLDCYCWKQPMRRPEVRD